MNELVTAVGLAKGKGHLIAYLHRRGKVRRTVKRHSHRRPVKRLDGCMLKGDLAIGHFFNHALALPNRLFGRHGHCHTMMLMGGNVFSGKCGKGEQQRRDRQHSGKDKHVMYSNKVDKKYV